MIINNNTASYSALSPALTRQTKSASQKNAGDSAKSSQVDTDDQSLSVSDDDLTTVGSPVQDVDAANAIMENMRQALTNQPKLAMLAQGNSVALSALRLLQQ